MNKKAEKILNTSIKLFSHTGIKSITMDDIASNAVVSKVTIYKYFGDKDTLYLEVSKWIFSTYTAKFDTIIASDKALIKRLYDFLDVICRFTDSGQFDLCRELSRYNGEIEAEFVLYQQTYERSVEALIDEGINSGLIKDNLNRDMIFYYIDMGVAYYQQNPEYRNRMLNDEKFQQQLMLFLISNIFADEVQKFPAI